MKISVKQLVMLCLGMFLVKIVIADPYREQSAPGQRGPASQSVRVQGPSQSRGLKGALVKQGRFSDFKIKQKVIN